MKADQIGVKLHIWHKYPRSLLTIASNKEKYQIQLENVKNQVQMDREKKLFEMVFGQDKEL